MGQLRFTGGAENIFTRTRGRAETGPRGPRIRRCGGGAGPAGPPGSSPAGLAVLGARSSSCNKRAGV